MRLLLAQVSQDPGLAGPYDLLACGHDGRELEVELTVRPLSDVEFDGYVVTVRDVTDARRIARQLANSRRRDELTGLLTREAFLGELSDRVERRRADSPIAVVVVDLERFAALNDGMGHETGDLILIAVARSFERLPEAVRATARLGSDGFAWIIDAHEAPPAVGTAVEQCARELHGLILSDGREVQVGLRAGYVLVDPAHPRPLGWYLEAADMALKRAKASRHNHLVEYESGMQEEVERRIAAERRLRRALADGRLEVHYQPVVGLVDTVVHGAEALVRLRDEGGALVPPDEFIPLAEELGLIRELGREVLRTACRQTVEAGRRVGRPLRIAVNVAADQLRPELPWEVAGALSASGLDPDLLTLELTESALADRAELTDQVLVEVRALGVWVSLDDFGTGYSSMSYLARLPVAGLKIDRSFVSVLGTSAHGFTLARMVVQLADSLGLSHRRRGDRDGGAGGPAARHGLRLRAGLPLRAPDAVRGLRRVPAGAGSASRPGLTARRRPSRVGAMHHDGEHGDMRARPSLRAMSVLERSLAALLVAIACAGCVAEGSRSPTSSTGRPGVASPPSSTAARVPQSPAPSSTRPPSALPPSAAPAPGSALAALARLPVKGRAPRTGYSRDEFGQAWADVDRNGCDTRNDTLRRDLDRTVVKPGTHGCVVLRGTLADPYTGATIPFVRGVGTSLAVQIDHVVALGDAWQKGAARLTTAERTAFANDPLNLLAVSGSANRRKSDSDAASWLPPLKASRCAYVARQVAVKQTYRLWITAAERDAIRRVLATCPRQPLPTR